MTKTIFVSSSDSNYFPMLIEWVHSVRRFPQSEGIDIGILNAGLTQEQIETLRSVGCNVVDAQWPCPLPEKKIKGKEYLKSCVCRPFLPSYFPGYDMIVWMDADTWIQKWEPVEMFMAAAQRGRMALTSQADRAYPRQVRLKWLGRLPYKLRGFYFSNAKEAFGFKKAKELYPYNVLLAGMFALRADAPHWEKWQELMKSALKKGKIFTAEQLSLGLLGYIEKYPIDILPAWTHWLCQFKPLWNETTQSFVEPYMPYNEIGVLHMSGWDEMRLNRALTTDFKTMNDGMVEKSYRYPHFDGEKV